MQKLLEVAMCATCLPSGVSDANAAQRAAQAPSKTDAILSGPISAP